MEAKKFSNRARNVSNAINGIISETIDGGTPQSFSYDDAGRLTDDGTRAYTWDRGDRLLETDDGVTTVDYAYNGLGHRIRQDSTDYLLDTVQGLPRVIADTTGSTINRYVFSDYGLARHQKSDSSWVHPLRDGLGSVRHIVDASLDPLYSVNHAPYGERWNAQGSSPMPFGFTGEWQDPNDLLFLRARYYNPAQATFLSLDPLEGGVGNVRILNRYSYVQADPVNFVDPSGLYNCSINGVISGACVQLRDAVSRAEMAGVVGVRVDDLLNTIFTENRQNSEEKAFRFAETYIETLFGVSIELWRTDPQQMLSQYTNCTLAPKNPGPSVRPHM